MNLFQRHGESHGHGVRKICGVPGAFGVLGSAAALLFSAQVLAADLGGSMKDTDFEDPRRQLELSANVGLTTDYVFRGFSQTDEGPAVQGGFDLTYGSFYAGVWGSNLEFEDDGTNIELDFYAGFTPKWRNLDFDFGVIYYAYPDGDDSGGELDFWELKAGVSGKVADPVTLGVTVYYSPDYTLEVGDNWVFEGTAEVALPAFTRVSPVLKGTLAWQEGDEDEGGIDYGYYNIGMGFTFREKFSLDVLFWDTFDLDGCNTATVFQCDERVVATLSASF